MCRRRLSGFSRFSLRKMELPSAAEVEEQAPAAVVCQAAVQNYDWGVRGGGENGLVARMAGAAPAPGTPFAELWMGTHAKAPLTLAHGAGAAAPGCLLSDFFRLYPAFAGERTVAAYGDQLPYLFKCLSVDKALSIQAHPNKQLARELHSKDPQNYPDENHKPELACAVTPFEGLCGFRPLPEIARHLSEFPELRSLVSDPLASHLEAEAVQDDGAQAAALKAAFAAVMLSSPEAVKAQAEALVARLQAKDAAARSTTEALVLRINAQYPGDVGLFNILFLNHCVLQPGQALFLGPNLPHAYISGDCMEIMATSDNVVRAGFTNKFKDVDTLVQMLHYHCALPTVLIGDEDASGSVRLLAPPGDSVPEFALRQVTLRGGAVDLGSSVSPRTVICVSGGPSTLSAQAAVGLVGCTLEITAGQVVVVGAGASLSASGGQADVGTVMFVASCHPCCEPHGNGT